LKGEDVDENQEDKNELWDSFLNFLGLELFGPEVYDLYAAGANTLEDPAPGENPLPDHLLADFEWKIFRIAEAARAYVQAEKFNLSFGRAGYLERAAHALSKLFWAMATARPQLFDLALGVRKGGPKGIQLVELTAPKENPLLKLMKLGG
jgi:hypothetical protein